MFRSFLKTFWEKILLPACGFFTLFVFLLALATSFASPDVTPAIPLSQAMVLLLFSLVLAALNRILYARALPLPVRVGVHFLSSTGALVLILLVMSGFAAKNGVSSTLFLTVFYIVLYAIVLIVLLILRAFGIRPLHLPSGDKPSPREKKKE